MDLLLEKGADRDVRNKFGQCAADFAVEKGHWMVYARLDPVGAMVKSEAVHRRFADAAVVHVLSTRSRKDASQLDRKHPAFVRMACEPTRTAENLQRYLEEVEGVRVFNPNVDNAFLLGGLTDPEAVLERGYSITRLPGGKVLQDARDALPGTALETTLAHGSVRSVVG